MTIPTVSADAIGWISEEQMIEVDRVMIEDLRIELIQMMENAGRNLANLILERAAPTRVAVAAGSGGNGGGGLVAARHLTNAGVDVAVALTRAPADLRGVPAHQLDVLQRMGVSIVDSLPNADVTVDAVIGYSLRGAPRGRSAELIAAINGSEAVVSLDNPSGLDVTTGETPGDVVTADMTMTLCLPKSGLRAASHVGDLYLADISVPSSVTEPLGPAAPDFSRGPLLRIESDR